MIEFSLWILLNGFYLYLATEYIGLLWRPKLERQILIILFSVILWCSVNIGCYFLNYMEGIPESIALIWLLSLFMAAVLILYGLKKVMEDRKRLDFHLRQQQMDLISKQYEVISANQEETRRQRHELKNNYLAIELMAKKGELNNIISFVNNLNESLHKNKFPASTGNIAVDAVINYKINHSPIRDICFQLDLNIPIELDVKEAVLCGVLGNALDNAIEASIKLPIEERKIIVSMSVKHKNLFIEVTNNYDGIILTDNLGHLKTRKDDKMNHGFGLSEMTQLLERNSGNIELVWSDRQFQTRIVFYHVL